MMKQGGVLAKITQKIVLYTYCPDEPVKPIGQTVDNNYEFLTKTSLANKESKKKKWRMIPSSDKGDTIETSSSSLNLTYSNKLQLS